MKTIRICVLFIIIASFSWADDWETYDVIDRLLTIREPGAPVIYENYVIFTAASNIRNIGVAFAHESFIPVYWFRQLVVSQDWADPVILPGQKLPSPYKDSGLQFHVYQIPDNLRELEYRLVVNGLWSIDPANPNSRRDPVSGLTMSVLSVPARPANYNPLNGLPQGLNFTFKGPPGETVTVAGNFNGWDPFMYELREGPAGTYTIIIPLPPGVYQYVFFHKGQRFVDPHNPRRIYARDGSVASEVVIP
jgi:hypothetical protein